MSSKAGFNPGLQPFTANVDDYAFAYNCLQQVEQQVHTSPILTSPDFFMHAVAKPVTATDTTTTQTQSDAEFLKGFFPKDPNPRVVVAWPHTDVAPTVALLVPRVKDIWHRTHGTPTPQVAGASAISMGTGIAYTYMWSQLFASACERADYAKEIGDKDALWTARMGMLVAAVNVLIGFLGTLSSTIGTFWRYISKLPGVEHVHKVLLFAGRISGILTVLYFLYGLYGQIATAYKANQLKKELANCTDDAGKRRVLLGRLGLNEKGTPLTQEIESARITHLCNGTAERANKELSQRGLGQLVHREDGTIVMANRSPDFMQAARETLAHADKEKKLAELSGLLGSDLVNDITTNKAHMQTVMAALDDTIASSGQKGGLFVLHIGLILAQMFAGASLGPWVLPVLSLFLVLAWLYYDTQGWTAALESGRATMRDYNFLNGCQFLAVLGAAVGIAMEKSAGNIAVTLIMLFILLFFDQYAKDRVKETAKDRIAEERKAYATEAAKKDEDYARLRNWRLSHGF